MTALFFFLSLAAAMSAARRAKVRRGEAAAISVAAVVLAAGGAVCELAQREVVEAASLSLGCATAVTVLAVGFFFETTGRVSPSAVRLAASLCVWFGASAPLFAVMALAALLLEKPFGAAAEMAARRWWATAAKLGGAGWLEPWAAKAPALRAAAPVVLCGLAAVMAGAALG